MTQRGPVFLGAGPGARGSAGVGAGGLDDRLALWRRGAVGWRDGHLFQLVHPIALDLDQRHGRFGWTGSGFFIGGGGSGGRLLSGRLLGLVPSVAVGLIGMTLQVLPRALE